MTTYESLVARHESLHQQFADDPDSIEIELAQQLIEEARAAGREVIEIPQRQQLRAILRYWGNFIHDRTGAYPNTHLLPYSPGAAVVADETDQPPTEESSALVPVSPSTRNILSEDNRPPWFWPAVVGVIVAAIVLALLASAVWNRLNNPDTDEPVPIAAASPSAVLPGVEDDSDQDGLSDQQETLLGTEVTTPDTDGDGLLDGEELLMHGTNPAAADSDGDGMSDGDEVALGTLPTDPGSVGTIGAYPSATITTTATITVSQTITVTATPELPSGPILFVTAPEGQAVVALRIGPSDNFAIVETKPDVVVGAVALIVRRTPDNSWYAIALSDGSSGWLPATNATVPETTNIAAVPTFVPPQQ